jgi:hypothetical protein
MPAALTHSLPHIQKLEWIIVPARFFVVQSLIRDNTIPQVVLTQKSPRSIQSIAILRLFCLT